MLNASGTLIFLDTPLNIGANTFFSNSAGVILLGVTGNVWGKTQIFSGTLRMGIANALPSAVSLEIGTTAQADGVLDLNGFDQTVGTFGGPVKANAIGYLTSTLPATLTVNQGADKVYERPIHGAVSFVKAGASTLTMSNSLSTTTGDITVSNGTLVVATASSLGNSANVAVAGATSVLELRTASGIADAARLSIADGGTVNIGAGLVETVDRLFLDGVQQARGSWGATGSGATHIDDDHFQGTGQLLVTSNPPVTPADATWDAEGADSLLSTTNNWEGDLLPAFNGATYAKFGTGGSTATVDRAVSLYGMEFTRDGNFTVAAGDGVVTNGAGGITAAVPNTTSRAYAVSEDLILSDSQVWNVINNGAGLATLTVSGSVGSDPFYPFSLTKAGNGTLVLSGSNTYEGVTTVANGTLAITQGSALGSTNGNTVVNCASGGFLQFSGNITVDEPITFNGELAGSNGSFLNSSGSNTLNGAITTFSQVRTKVNGGSILVVRGGVRRGDSGTGVYLLVLNTSGTLAFYDTPLTLGNNVFFSNAGDLIVLGVAGNTWSETQIVSGTLRLDIANALPAAAPLKIGVPAHATGILDLNGFDQTVGSLGGPVKTPATSYLTSTRPATLTVNQSADAIYERPLNGAVSLVKAGTATLTMSNSLSTTTGDITVNDGTLVVAPASNLGNSTNVAVAAGTLTIQTSSGISDSACLFIADGGAAKVNLAAGVNETVSWLYLGGKMQRAGTYSAASGSGVMVTDTEHFAGTGILTVLHDKSGTLIKLN
ncbi:MAG: autotransporter-associated beta strand repeat-containing protein [Kiritimatiellae bacterium]|nr:autotransporter-associated beta strand repeat-containing protein [Kiritimatiellia bacterium]